MRDLLIRATLRALWLGLLLLSACGSGLEQRVGILERLVGDLAEHSQCHPDVQFFLDQLDLQKCSEFCSDKATSEVRRAVKYLDSRFVSVIQSQPHVVLYPHRGANLTLDKRLESEELRSIVKLVQAPRIDHITKFLLIRNTDKIEEADRVLLEQIQDYFVRPKGSGRAGEAAPPQIVQRELTPVIKLLLAFSLQRNETLRRFEQPPAWLREDLRGMFPQRVGRRSPGSEENDQRQYYDEALRRSVWLIRTNCRIGVSEEETAR